MESEEMELEGSNKAGTVGKGHGVAGSRTQVAVVDDLKDAEEVPKEVPKDLKGYTKFEHFFTDMFADKPGEVEVVHHFKKPSRPQISRAQKTLNKDAMKAFGTFLGEIVHPDERDQLAENIKKHPGVAATFGNAVMAAVGIADLGN